ncbi:hypothetical protein Scep_001884 [Stephania cephalantha]|uniref:Uncharacterized protein n=1 Tax=Stephania cephalantha TaxID=152367 RepID=A0AAP0L8Z2_9MAGN
MKRQNSNEGASCRYAKVKIEMSTKKNDQIFTLLRNIYLEYSLCTTYSFKDVTERNRAKIGWKELCERKFLHRGLGNKCAIEIIGLKRLKVPSKYSMASRRNGTTLSRHEFKRLYYMGGSPGLNRHLTLSNTELSQVTAFKPEPAE